MALVRCPECRKKFSDKAPACPSCGAPVALTIQAAKATKKQEDMIKGWSLLIVLIGGAYLFWGHGSKDTAPAAGSGASPTTTTTTIAPPPKPALPKVQDGAVMAYDRKQNPKAYAKYGDAAIARVNKLQPEFALRVSAYPLCDSVVNVGIADTRSTKNDMMLYADCNNGQRFRATESALKAGNSILADSQVLSRYNNGEAMVMCAEHIKAKLKYPSSYDQSYLNSRTFVTPTGEVIVELAFEAKNGLGNTIPQKGQCTIIDGRMGPANLFDR